MSVRLIQPILFGIHGQLFQIEVFLCPKALVSGHLLFAWFGFVAFLLPLLDWAKYGCLKTFLFSELRSLRTSASCVSGEYQDCVFWNFL